MHLECQLIIIVCLLGDVGILCVTHLEIVVEYLIHTKRMNSCTLNTKHWYIRFSLPSIMYSGWYVCVCVLSVVLESYEFAQKNVHLICVFLLHVSVYLICAYFSWLMAVPIV